MTDAELAGVAGRRSGTWWLLSRLVTEQPQEPWLGELETALAAIDPDAAGPLACEAMSLSDALYAARRQTGGVTALAVDRTSLLAGVMNKDSLPAPYESAALGLPMNSELVIDVTERYREAGLEDLGRECGPADFLGTELRFMALLAYQEMKAHQAGEAESAADWLSRQARFLDDHLLRWVPQHCAQLQAMAATPFYGALALLLGRACELDREDIAEASECMIQ